MGRPRDASQSPDSVRDRSDRRYGGRRCQSRIRQAGVTVRIGKDHHNNKRWHGRRCDTKTVKTRFYDSYRKAYVIKVVKKPYTRCW